MRNETTLDWNRIAVGDAVAPMTMPVPWSMKNDRPMLAAGWMSMPVAPCAYSVSMRGSSGTSRWCSSCARR